MRNPMKTCMLRILLMSFAICLIGHASRLHGTVIIPTEFRSLLESATKPGVYENGDYAGIYNKHTGLLFDKKSGNLVGIWDRKGWTAASNLDAGGHALCPLWQAEIMPFGEEKSLAADSGISSPASIEVTSDGAAATARLVWTGMTVDAYQFSVEARASLAAEDAGIRWRVSIPNDPESHFSVWSVSFPLIAVPAFDANDNNRLALPVRRGVLRPYGPDAPRGAVPLPYPGPSAKFQFMAAYGAVSRRGLYFATDDGEGYSKVFHYANEPRHSAVILKTEHLPANRGIPGTGFSSPYSIITSPFQGDWWTAARIYRSWWVNQIWASKGLLQDRGDVPDWMKNAPVCLRFSTSKPDRTIPTNMSAGIAISDFLNKAAFFGIWYAPFGERVGFSERGLFETGHGHTLPVSQEVKAALAAMKERGVHFLAYIQSVIYDANFPGVTDEDIRQAQANVSRDRKGRIIYYGVETEESGKYAMNRGSAWWQRRVAEQAVIAVKNGFCGVYLDSFGKGEAENFFPHSGQSAGGGNSAIAGQRKMAEYLTEAMREAGSEAILSGEDPVEAFRDLVQANLYAVNSYEGYIPIYRTVWGDYSLGYGRNISISKDATADIAEMTRLFVDGDVLGRFFCDGGDRVWKDSKEGVTQKQYLQKAANFTAKTLDWLRFGEYLRPLDLGVPLVEYAEGVGANKTTAPAVLNSVTRSHRDGSIGIVCVNISDSPVTFDLDLSSLEVEELPKTLSRMTEQGDLEAIEGGSARKHSVTIQPYDIHFYILR